MYRLNYAPFVCYSPDETGGGAVVIEPPAAPTAPDATQASPAAQPGDKPDAKAAEAEGPDYKALLAESAAKYEKRIAAMGRTMQRMHEAQGADTKQASAKVEAPSDTNDHPLLKDLETDADGDVKLDGQWVTPAYAKRILEQEARMRALEEGEGVRRTKAQQAEYDAERDQAVENFAGMVCETAAIVLPGLKGEAALCLREELEEAALVAYSRLDAATRGLPADERNAAIAAETTRIAERKRNVYTALISAQLESNKKYADEHPSTTKPDGQPGHAAPKDRSKMTKSELEADRTARVAKAEAEAGRP